MSNVAKPDRPRFQLKPGGTISRIPLAQLEQQTGYSGGRLREILKGKQIGEAFMAMIVYVYSGKVEDYFELVGPSTAVTVKKYGSYVPRFPELDETLAESILDAPAEVPVRKPEWPTSWHEAVDAGIKPETGPPLFPGADEFQEERVVLLDNGVPVLAFEADNTIRTYPSTKLSPGAMAVLAYHGHTEWAGNSLAPRKES